MLVKRENKGSGGIADVIEGVNRDSCCWYQGMKFSSPFSQKAILQPDGVCWVTAHSSAWRVGHWYPGIGWTYPQLLPLMQIQHGLVRLSWEAVWFASVYASFRERSIAIQEDMVRKRKNIRWCILLIWGRVDGVPLEQEPEIFNRFTGIAVLWLWSLSFCLPLL